MTHHSGFVSFVGRPNAGKSTLMNALVGEKVAITSDKPQTTRRVIRGIVTRPDGQLVIVDTPGIHRPRTLLGKRLNTLVQSTLGDVDVIGQCIPANERVGPGDRYIAEQIAQFPRAKRVAIVTKTDATSRRETAERLLEVDQLGEWDTIVPLSSVTGEQLDVLVQELLVLCPEGPALYAPEQTTDEDRTTRIAELIREAALVHVRDELPHSIMVTVDDIVEDEIRVSIYANLWVERDSQKGIVIGHGAERIREIGQTARHEIEALIEREVYLDLRVKVAKDWQRDPKQLGRFGF